MCERVENQVRNKQERREEERECNGVRTSQRMGQPLTYPFTECKGLKQNVPTVKPQKSAQINAKAAQAGHSGDERPTRDSPKHSAHYGLHQKQRYETHHQTYNRE